MARRIEYGQEGKKRESARAQRRRAGRAHGSRRTREIAVGVNRVSSQRTEAVERGIEVIKEMGGNFTALAYRGEPFAQEVLSTSQQVHGQIQAARATQHPELDYLESYADLHDTYGHQVNGLSLAELERMEIDRETSYLKNEDSRKINKFFRGREYPILGKFKRFRQSSKNHSVLDSTIVFAVQSWARPETKNLSPSLRKLQRNLDAYFDHFVDLTLDPTLELEDRNILLQAIAWGGPMFDAAFAGYLPARLGISPSSAMKIYKQKELEGLVRGGRNWRNVRKTHLEHSTREAYLIDALPDDLAPYQFYDEATDARATRAIQSHYKTAISSDTEQFAFHERARSATDRLVSTFPKVIKRIFSDPDQRIELPIEEGHAISGVTVTAVNRRTLMFIVHLGEDTHVTLEMNRDRQLFGLPPELLKKYPNIGDMIKADVLPPLLDLFPAQKQEVVVYQRPPAPPKPVVSVKSETDDEPKVKVKTRGKPRLEQEPDLPTPETRVKAKVRFVSHTEDQVRELLGKRHATDDVVARVMNAISRFEHGESVDFAALKDEKKGFYRLKTGDWRVILEEEEADGRQMLVLHDVKDRRDLTSAGGAQYRSILRRRSSRNN